MLSKTHDQDHHFDLPFTPASAVLVIIATLVFLILLIAFLCLAAHPAQAQTYRVLYTFTGSQDGGSPRAGLSMDATENLYGITPREAHLDPVSLTSAAVDAARYSS